MQLYKTEKLIKDGVNFSAIYDQKQDKVKELTGFEFDLTNIVDFLKAQTNNFQTQNSLAFDIDGQIYSIYTKWVNETDKKSAPSERPSGEAPSGGEATPSIETYEKRLKLLTKRYAKSPTKSDEIRIKTITKILAKNK